MKKILAILAAVGLVACSGCNLFEGTKDEKRPDVLNSGEIDGDITVVTVGGQNNDVDVRGRSNETVAP
jgi:hypothetical protein